MWQRSYWEGEGHFKHLSHVILCCFGRSSLNLTSWKHECNFTLTWCKILLDVLSIFFYWFDFNSDEHAVFLLWSGHIPWPSERTLDYVTRIAWWRYLHWIVAFPVWECNSATAFPGTCIVRAPRTPVAVNRFQSSFLYTLALDAPLWFEKKKHETLKFVSVSTDSS